MFVKKLKDKDLTTSRVKMDIYNFYEENLVIASISQNEIIEDVIT